MVRVVRVVRDEGVRCRPSLGGRREGRREGWREGGALLCDILHHCPSYHKKYFDFGLAPVVLGCFKLLQMYCQVNKTTRTLSNVPTFSCFAAVLSQNKGLNLCWKKQVT